MSDIVIGKGSGEETFRTRTVVLMYVPSGPARTGQRLVDGGSQQAVARGRGVKAI